jgi:hypothetical protein
VATKRLFILGILFTAISMSGGLAHLFELPNKIHLMDQDYLTVQQIYRGWALLGIAVVGALLSTMILCVLVRTDTQRFPQVLIAMICIALSLVIFFLVTYPVNQETENWTHLPANWRELRQRWEYSHAVNAVLYLFAFIALLMAALREGKPWN